MCDQDKKYCCRLSLRRPEVVTFADNRLPMFVNDVQDLGMRMACTPIEQKAKQQKTDNDMGTGRY